MLGYLLEQCIKIWLAIFLIFQWILFKFWLFYFQKIIEFVTKKFRNFTPKSKAAPWFLDHLWMSKDPFLIKKKKKGFGQGLTYWHQPNCLGMLATMRTWPKIVPFLSSLVLVTWANSYVLNPSKASKSLMNLKHVYGH